jgi:glucokinase
MSETFSLIADIGGTHVRFALIAPGQPPAEAVKLRCADYAGPAEAAQAYLATTAPGARLRRGAFAVACPVGGDRIDLTNSPWGFSIEQVRTALGMERLDVVNDFTAVALSVLHLGDDDLLKLGGAAPLAGSPIAVLGPGTGLGVSALVPTRTGQWEALAAEGGHATLPAADDREAQLIAILRKRFDHVSAERVLSGPGIVNLYEAVCTLRSRQAAYTTPDAITQRALDGSCPQCKETMETFFTMLGTVAGNLALQLGARGGVFIAGGILPRMAQSFAASGFRARFEAKGRFQAYLAPVPAWLITHPQPAFAGLAGLVSGV